MYCAFSHIGVSPTNKMKNNIRVSFCCCSIYVAFQPIYFALTQSHSLSHFFTHTLLLFIAYLCSSFLILILVQLFDDKIPVFYLSLSVCFNTKILSNSPFFLNSTIPNRNDYLTSTKKKRIEKNFAHRHEKKNFEKWSFSNSILMSRCWWCVSSSFLTCLPSQLLWFAFFFFTHTRAHTMNVYEWVRVFSLLLTFDFLYISATKYTMQ